MTTADYALVVSICSAVLSLAGFVWAIWSKWVYPKAKVKVSIAVMTMITDEDKDSFIGIYATNFGPSDTTLKLLVTRSRPEGWAWRFKVGKLRRYRYGWMMSTNDVDHAIAGDGPAPTSGLPHKLVVGGEFGTYTTYNHPHLRKGEIIDVGFTDVFGRTHYAPRREVRKVVESIRKQFPEEKA